MIRGYNNNKNKYVIASPKNAKKLREQSDHKSIICPSCEGNLIFVNARKKIKHFRHEVESDCNFEPETQRHLEMKRIIIDKLNLDEDCLEVPLNFGTPDILDKDNKIAIEVQHSKLGYKEFMNRTKNYNKKDYFPLWIFDWDLLNKFIYERTKTRDRINIPDFLKKAHQLYYGRIYCLYEEKIYPLHFAPLQRWKEEYHNYKTDEIYGGYWKYYKKKKVLMVGDEINNYNLLKTDNNGINIARFYDKKFWGDEDEFKD